MDLRIRAMQRELGIKDARGFVKAFYEAGLSHVVENASLYPDHRRREARPTVPRHREGAGVRGRGRETLGTVDRSQSRAGRQGQEIMTAHADQHLWDCLVYAATAAMIGGVGERLGPCVPPTAIIKRELPEPRGGTSSFMDDLSER